MVLVGHRRPEHRHQAVAHPPADRAFVPMDGVHHPLHGAVEQALGVLVVAPLDQRRRADDVGEQDRDVLTLTFEGRRRGWRRRCGRDG